jgi:hypothetical protein
MAGQSYGTATCDPTREGATAVEGFAIFARRVCGARTKDQQGKTVERMNRELICYMMDRWTYEEKDASTEVHEGLHR